MLKDGLLGPLAAWCGREIVKSTPDVSFFAVQLDAQQNPKIIPVPPDNQKAVEQMVARWDNNQITAVGFTSRFGVQPDSDGMRTVGEAVQNKFAEIENMPAVQTTVLVFPDGRDAVAFTSLLDSGSVSKGFEQTAEQALAFSIEQPAFVVVDDQLASLRGQLRLATRPVTDDPLWWMLCVWAERVAANWNSLIESNEGSVQQAALSALDARPDIAFKTMTSLRAKKGERWPSDKWAGMDAAKVASALIADDQLVAKYASGHRWQVVVDTWEVTNAEQAILDGPGLMRFGFVGFPQQMDPIITLASVDPDIPDWLGQSTVRVAQLWRPSWLEEDDEPELEGDADVGGSIFDDDDDDEPVMQQRPARPEPEPVEETGGGSIFDDDDEDFEDPFSQ